MFPLTEDHNWVAIPFADRISFPEVDSVNKPSYSMIFLSSESKI